PTRTPSSRSAPQPHCNPVVHHEVRTHSPADRPSLVLSLCPLAGFARRRKQPRPRRRRRRRCARPAPGRSRRDRQPRARQHHPAPWLAARLEMPGISGPHIAQACATSVACLVAAAHQVEGDADALPLVVTTDRTSNGPVLVHPRTRAMGGSPVVENWVLDNFAADPNTGKAMVATAENVARDGAMSRQALDELTMLRWRQYEQALADD